MPNASRVDLSVFPRRLRGPFPMRGAAIAALALERGVCRVGCGSQSKYDVATCAFGSTETQCAPISAEGARAQHELHFALIDPNTGAPHGCCEASLDVDDTVSGTGKMHRHGQEKDPTACTPTWAELEGVKEIGEGQTVDLHFPSANFAFRIEVKPAPPSGN